MINNKAKSLFGLIFLILLGCENRDINEGEKFRPRELLDSFDESHFTRITVDGVDYLMMERDNNNPHEGFGFMAFRANKMYEKQDTTLAYLRTINEYQTRIYAKLFNISLNEARLQNLETFKKYLDLEGAEMLELEKETLLSEGSKSSISSEPETTEE